MREKREEDQLVLKISQTSEIEAILSKNPMASGGVDHVEKLAIMLEHVINSDLVYLAVTFVV